MRAFIRADAGALDVDADAHADVVAGRLRAQQRDRLVEQHRVVAAVVNHRVAVLPGDANIVWKVAGLDQVAAPHLDAIDAEVRRDRVERALHHEACVRPARAAIRRSRNGVRVQVAKPDTVVGDAVRPGHLGRRDDRQDDSVRRVGAAVEEVVMQGEQTAFVVKPDLDLVHLAALLVDGGEVLLPVLGPLHGASELHRRVRHEELVRVEQHDLGSETAAHVGGDDVDARLGQAEKHRQAAADRGRRLGRVVDREPVLVGRPARPHGACLHRACSPALVAKAQPLPARRRGHGRVHVANLLQHLRGDVAGHIAVHQMLGARGHLGRDHDRQRLVLDLHELGRVFGQVPVFRDHECDRLARVAHDLRCEAALRAAVRQVGMRDQEREVHIPKREIGGRVDGDHAGHRARGGGIDRCDSRMRIRRAHETALQRVFADIVGEAAMTAEQTVILDALHRGAEPTRGHSAPSPPFPTSGEDSAAARSTERRIDA